MSTSEQPKSERAQNEEKVLAFWAQNDIFNKSMSRTENPAGEFVFYEGPPTANGTPGIHHLEARAFKDAIPRYKTMRGYHVRRKGGWDTHGLPVELQVEKKLGLNSKKAIEEYGIASFNQQCKESVWQYLDIWNTFTKRIGYWVDQDNPYVTYHNTYIESVWNVVKKIDDQGLLYKDYKIVPWCPRCGTALSSHELAQGYEDVKDLSVYVKFKVVGQDNTYILAWTTTPWTLPGNVGLAVGKDIEYVKVDAHQAQVDTNTSFNGKHETLIIAKEIFEKVAASDAYTNGEYRIFHGFAGKVIETIKGSELVGLSYEPLYPYLAELNKNDEKMTNAYKVYTADFVTTTDGTGVVHTAVMYGADDFELGTKENLPKFHLVNPDGTFIAGTDFLAGRFVKEKDENGKPTLAVDIIDDLKKSGLFFAQENIKHSYPHCWRCKTPLIYYARDSWYIRMSSLRDKLVAENESINWEPAHIREGRFGEWLDGIKDWAISRERYWGTPLPMWLTASGTRVIMDSLATLRAYTKKSGNTYFAMRHGYGQHMEQGVVSSLDHDSYHLTEAGRVEVARQADTLRGKGITRIITSPLIRTTETARIVAEHLGLDVNSIIVDDRLREYDFGDWNGKPWQDFVAYRAEHVKNYTDTLGGTSLLETKNRFGAFIYDMEKQYQNETLLFVTHGIFFETMPAVVEGADNKRATEILFESFKNHRIQPAEIRQIDFVPLPHNENYELDLHRPYIDTIELVTPEGETLTRTKEVMDVWFDSGCMPFAQDHYPFENKAWVDGPGYPADFISEAIDQTRGWFYTLHAVGVLLGRGKAYKNVICLGHILDATGKKMSKSLGNIVDPWSQIEKYGVDTLRLWMYSVNQPGDSKNYDEKTVAELHNKFFNTFYNVLAFYELYRDTTLETDAFSYNSSHVLDQWIIARQNELIGQMTQYLDNYKLFEPVRLMRDFIDDLSTWYLRRTRERLKDGDADAKRTLYRVLKNFTLLMAPLAPFAAEDIWQKIKTNTDVESVHLALWPTLVLTENSTEDFVTLSIIKQMDSVRQIVRAGLEARQKVGIKVRQPLQSITVSAYMLGEKDIELGEEYFEIIKDELNIKEIIASHDTETVQLDTTITPELKREGQYRELVRAIQDLRKTTGLMPEDRIVLTITTDTVGQELVNQFMNDLKKTVGASEVVFGKTEGDDLKIDDLMFGVKITR